jgi:hypothetical protein
MFKMLMPIPAQAGIYSKQFWKIVWIPAFARKGALEKSKSGNPNLPV